MLMRLLRTHLRPYKRTLWLIVVLTIVQTTAALTLPTINARIIDNGMAYASNGSVYFDTQQFRWVGPWRWLGECWLHGVVVCGCGCGCGCGCAL